MNVSVDTIKQLRELTSCGVIECRKALEESKGDIKKAKEILQKRGMEMAAKKTTRVAKEGRIESYIHQGSKLGVIVEINCETDFVAQTDDFKRFAKDVAMHIAAAHPKYVKKEDVPADVLKAQDDPDIFVKDTCLVNQLFIKDPTVTIQDLLHSLISKTGENIFISRFIRYKINEI